MVRPTSAHIAVSLLVLGALIISVGLALVALPLGIVALGLSVAGSGLLAINVSPTRARRGGAE